MAAVHKHFKKMKNLCSKIGELKTTHLQANISSLAFLDYPGYVETTAELQPSSHTQTEAFSVAPIQTNLFQLPENRKRCEQRGVRHVESERSKKEIQGARNSP